MFRNRWYGVFSDEGGAAGAGAGAGSGVELDLTDELKASDPQEYWKRYWKKESGAASAFVARDQTRQRMKELEAQVAKAEQEKRERDAKAEEEKLKAAGQWDGLRVQLTEKHAKELADREAALQKERDRRIKRSVDAAFGSLTSGSADYFSGSEGSKTVWDVWTAQRALGQFVHVEDNDAGDEVIVVKDPKGNTIIGDDGNPAPFATAIGELIKLLPNKDRILRGSGKTGSGSSGGATGGREPIDLRNLTPAQRRDPKILAQLRAQRPEGGIVMGEAYRS